MVVVLVGGGGGEGVLNFRRREKFPKSNKHKEGGDGVQILGILWELNNWMPSLE